MSEYLSPLEASQLTKWSERTWRDKCAREVIPGALKVGKQWLIPRDALRLCGILRGPEQEQHEPQVLAEDAEEMDIVTAVDEGRRGIYIDHDWFGAKAALRMLEYLRKHEEWLSMEPINFTDIPLAQRPETKVWQVITEQCAQGQAKLYQDGNGYLVQFTDEPSSIPFEHLAYNAELGLYDKRQFPNI